MPVENMRFEEINPPACPPKHVEKAAQKAKAAPKTEPKAVIPE